MGTSSIEKAKAETKARLDRASEPDSANPGTSKFVLIASPAPRRGGVEGHIVLSHYIPIAIVYRVPEP
jgi:hypothetical protein